MNKEWRKTSPLLETQACLTTGKMQILSFMALNLYMLLVPFSPNIWKLNYVLIANARIPTSFKSPQLYKGDESEVTRVFNSLTIIIQDNLHVPVINNHVEMMTLKIKKHSSLWALCDMRAIHPSCEGVVQNSQ